MIIISVIIISTLSGFIAGISMLLIINHTKYKDDEYDSDFDNIDLYHGAQYRIIE